MIKKHRHVMWFALVLLTAIPAFAVRWPGVECSLNGAPGDAKLLVNGNRGDGVEFGGSQSAALSIPLTIKIQGSQKIDRIELVSQSINKWWSIPRVVVSARQPKSEKWEILTDKPWYDRTSEPDSAPAKTFTFSVSAKGQAFDEIKVELCRPHGHFHLALHEIEVHVTDGVELGVETPWTHYQVGQTVKGTLLCENSFSSAIPDASLEVDLRDPNGEVLGVWKKTITLATGKAQLPFEIPVTRAGKLRLSPRFADGRKVTVANTPELTALPPRSKYWYPIGTGTGFYAQNYGFSMCHYWCGPLELQTGGNGLYASICAGPYLTPDVPANVPATDLLMKRSDETPAITNEYSYNLPGYRLADVYEKSLKMYDGHPLVYEHIYANEWCYVGWRTGGLVDYSPYAIRDYQKYLQDRYKTLAAINHLYGAKYTAFDSIDPPRRHVPGPAWHDWMEFRRISQAKYFKKVYDLVKPNMPNTPISCKPIHLTDSWTSMGGIDPWLWRDAMDVYNVNVYPWCRDGYFEAPLETDLHRTQIGDKKMQFPESGIGYFRPSPKDYTGLDLNRSYWPSFLRGVKGCYFYRWYNPWDDLQRRYELCDENETLNEQGEEVSRMAKQIQTLAPVLNFGKPLGIQTAVYFAWEEFDQAFNDVPNNALKGAHKILNQLHHPVDVITYHNIRAGELAKYKVLVLPGTKHMYPDVAKAICAFVEQGGLLIADQQAGFYDENHRPVRSLEPVLGVRHIQESDRLTQLAFGPDQRLDLPAIVGGPCPRAEVIRAQNGTRALGTFPKELLKPAAIDPVLLQAPTIGQLPTQTAKDQNAPPPPGLPAVIGHSFGKGKVLYFAAPIFNIYRNYFYDVSNGPYPVTRCNELQNQGNPLVRKVIAAFLTENRINPPAEVNVTHSDPEVDDMHFQILSSFGNEHCAILGVTNWGPRQRYKVPATMTLPFAKATKLYYVDTVRELVQEIPFTQEGTKLKTIIPFIEGTALLVAIGDGGPLLVQAEQLRSDPMNIGVRIMNHLPEKAEGMIQIRIDGIADPLSDQVPFTLAPNAVGNYKIPIHTVDEKLLTDNRGFRRPWYAWVTYDGTARSFARVHPTGTMLAP